MHRWTALLIVLLAALLLPLRAAAVAYALPGALPPGCSGSNGNYTCAGGSLSYGDTVTINAPKPATVTINGNFSTDTSSINVNGSASDLTLIVNGTLTLGYQARIKANITATSVNDAGGGQVQITGNLAANGGNIALAYQTTVSGNLSTSGSGTITTAQAGSVGGSISAGSGSITVSEASSVAGSVQGSGAVTVNQDATVSGNVGAGSGAVSIGYRTLVRGSITSSGSITLAQSAAVNGSINGGSGAVSVGYAATVTGTITTGSGSITFAQGAIASACVKSSAAAAITLGYQSNVHSVCCGTSCTSSCVANNSTYAMPPLCAGATSLIADYRMDETTPWSGAAGEVKDSSGNAHHGQAATASGGTPTAGIASGSPAYGSLSNGSCGYGSFNRASPSTTHAYVALPGGFPALTGSFTVLAWIRSTNPSQSGQRVFANDDAQNGWALSLGDVGSASLRLFNRNVTPSGSVTTSGSSGASAANCSGLLCLDSAPIFAANTWYYVALVVDTTNQQVQTSVYNTSGSLLTSASVGYTGTWTVGSGASALGGETVNSSEGSSSAFHFNGNIDELQVYSGVLDSSAIVAQLGRSRSCPVSVITSFAVAGTGSASTCSPQTLTLTARDAAGNTLTSYTGTVNLSTTSGRGDWSAGTGPAPAGSFVAGSANSGMASYTFAAADAGVVRLRLAHSLAQSVSVTVVDSGLPATSTTSAKINYSDNAFVWAEDLNSHIAGSNVAVAGRAHDLRVSLIKKDPVTGSCGVATDFSGNRSLKLWRSDSGGPWTAPSVVSPALTVPAARPGSNNLTLAFTAGVATLNLATTDIGKYTLNLDDDSLVYATSTVSGNSGGLTVRPFTLAVSGLSLGGTANPGGSAAGDAVFGKAGASFSATVAAYRWSTGADANNDGVPDVGATLAQVSAGGLAPGYNTAVALTPLAASQTPAGGVMGSLANGTVSGFAGGTVTVGNLAYSEVGSFALNTSAWVGSYLGTAGLALDGLVFNAAGAQQTRVGRFTPAGFAVSGASITHRSDLSCSNASTFTYLDENFRLGFTLTARNAAGATTQNYSGSFAKLDLAVPANLQLAGIAGSTLFRAANNRLLPASSSGSWSAGVAGVTLVAAPRRTTAPDGPFDTARFGVAPLDGDGVALLSPDLDTDSPANGADSALVGTIPLRYGRLRLQNAIGAAGRALNLPLAAQYWNGSAYNTNTLDNCTRISSTALSFGNFRKLDPADAPMSNSPVTLAGGVGRLTLAAPGSSRSGSVDLSIALAAGSPPTDSTCLQGAATRAATVGAGLPALRGLWCGSTARDPSARAVWGLYRGSDGVLFQRENY